MPTGPLMYTFCCSSGEPDSYGSPRAPVLTTIQTDTTIKPGKIFVIIQTIL